MAEPSRWLHRTAPGVPHRTRVKICCIASEEEAAIALDAGADLLGLVSAMPSGPIAEARIAEIVRWVGGRAETVLLTSRQEAEGISAQIERTCASVVEPVTRRQNYILPRRSQRVAEELPSTSDEPPHTAHPPRRFELLAVADRRRSA